MSAITISGPDDCHPLTPGKVMAAPEGIVVPVGGATTVCELTPRAEQQLPSTFEAAARARSFLREASCPSHAKPLLDEAVLLVSELVTNSLLHGGPPIVVAVECDGSGLQVRVRDGSRDLPEPRHPSFNDEGGRGLELVDLLSSEWGIDPRPDGKHVWFVLR